MRMRRLDQSMRCCLQDNLPNAITEVSISQSLMSNLDSRRDVF
jgi:hypothetical protein